MTGKRPTDHLEPAAKKRGSERQITKDDIEGSGDDEEVEAGTFARASDAVLKQRKIIRARHSAVPTSTTAASASNPFANVQLAPAGTAAVNPFAGVSLPPPKLAAEESKPAPATETAAPSAAPEKEEEPEAKPQEQPAPAKPAEEAKPAIGGFGGFGGGGLGGGLAFGGSGGFGAISAGVSAGAGGGFGGFASTATNGGGALAFGAAKSPSKEGEDTKSTTDADAKVDDSTTGGGTNPSSQYGGIFGGATATGTSLFGDASKPAASDFLAEVPVPTGEESERAVFTGDGVLYEFDAAKQWRERGRGQVRVNVDETKGQARVVMRQKGNLRLLLNANLWPEMQITRMDGGAGVTFACFNHLEGGEGGEAEEEKSKLATYALRIKSPEALDQFRSAVEEHKVRGKNQ